MGLGEADKYGPFGTLQDLISLKQQWMLIIQIFGDHFQGKILCQQLPEAAAAFRQVGRTRNRTNARSARRNFLGIVTTSGRCSAAGGSKIELWSPGALSQDVSLRVLRPFLSRQLAGDDIKMQCNPDFYRGVWLCWRGAQRPSNFKLDLKLDLTIVQMAHSDSVQELDNVPLSAWNWMRTWRPLWCPPRATAASTNSRSCEVKIKITMLAASQLHPLELVFLITPSKWLKHS